MNKVREDITLAVRFAVIVITDCLCWLPIVIIKLFALSNYKINRNCCWSIHRAALTQLLAESVYCWLIVFIMPINSALNPIIYTIASPSGIRSIVTNLIRRHVIDKLTCFTR